MNWPAITLWECRAAHKVLRERGAKQVDEPSLFRAIEQMRSVAERSVKLTKRARRDRERRRHLRQPERTALTEPPECSERASGAVKPFDELEQW